jgi:hypothetical protein
MTSITGSLSVVHLVLVAVLLLAAIGLVAATRRWYLRWMRRRRWAHAQSAESKAPLLLEKLGYEVLGAQVEETYTLLVDGEPMVVTLRADYVVGRGGKSYIAEVKSGRAAPRLNTAATRRQLLEYRMVFDVDGILLVDGETEQVHEVVFPLPSHKASAAWSEHRSELIVSLVLLAVILAALVLR